MLFPSTPPMKNCCANDHCAGAPDEPPRRSRTRSVVVVATGKASIAGNEGLLEDPWVLPESDTPPGFLIAEGFRSLGIPPLKARVVSNSLAVRIRLVVTKGFLTMLPGSMLHFGADRLPVRALPITLPMKSQPIEIVTLKNRTLSPVAKTFIECLRTVAKPLAKGRP